MIDFLFFFGKKKKKRTGAYSSSIAGQLGSPVVLDQAGPDRSSDVMAKAVFESVDPWAVPSYGTAGGALPMGVGAAGTTAARGQCW